MSLRSKNVWFWFCFILIFGGIFWASYFAYSYYYPPPVVFPPIVDSPPIMQVHANQQVAQLRIEGGIGEEVEIYAAPHSLGHYEDAGKQLLREYSLVPPLDWPANKTFHPGIEFVVNYCLDFYDEWSQIFIYVFVLNQSVHTDPIFLHRELNPVYTSRIYYVCPESDLDTYPPMPSQITPPPSKPFSPFLVALGFTIASGLFLDCLGFIFVPKPQLPSAELPANPSEISIRSRKDRHRRKKWTQAELMARFPNLRK